MTNEEIDQPAQASISASKPGAKPRPGLGQLPSIFQSLGLSTNESRALAALMELRMATATQIAERAGVARANIYPVLESLCAKRVVEAQPGKVSRWAVPSRDEVVRQLCEAQEERLAQANSQIEAQGQEALRVLSTLGPEDSTAPLPYVHVVTSDLQAVSIYFRHLSEADEVLVCNLGPYAGAVEVAEPIMEALARGIKAKALYQADELEKLDDLRQSAEAYVEAGVEARVVDELPMAMAVFDREVSVVVLPDPVTDDSGISTMLYVEHPGYAEACVMLFEKWWEGARPFPLAAGRNEPFSATCPTGSFQVEGASSGAVVRTSSRHRPGTQVSAK